jgi:hypothetical protein
MSRGRPAKWHGETEVIRLPKHAIAACLELAKTLDQPPPESAASSELEAYQTFVQNSLTPMLITVDGAQYVIRCDQPVTFETWKSLETLEAEVFQQCQEHGINPLVVLAQLAQEVYG